MVLMLLSCAMNHGVRPVGEGAVAVTASLGGPTLDFGGKPLPLPISQLGVRYGLSDRSDLHAALHPSFLAIYGGYAADVGLSRLIWEQDGPRPAVVVDGTLTAMWSAGSEDLEGGFRVLPQAAWLASWAWGGRGHLAYTGVDLLLQPRPARLIAAPLVGNRFLLTENLGLAVELKWANPWQETEDLTIRWLAPGRHGAIVAQAGLWVRFGGAG